MGRKEGKKEGRREGKRERRRGGGRKEGKREDPDLKPVISPRSPGSFLLENGIRTQDLGSRLCLLLLDCPYFHTICYQS
jgi:hypothetical protein